MPPRVAYPRADEAARHAIQLDPSLAGPHATLGYVETYFHWNWTAAEAAFRRAIDIEATSSIAHQWYAAFLTARGRFDEAEREMRRAAELDPLSMIAQAGIGWVLALANENTRAVRHLEQVLQLDPDFCLANFWVAIAHAQAGRAESGDPFLQRAMQLSPNNAFVLTWHAQARAGAGDVASAQAVLDTLLRRERSGEYISSYHLAKVHLALGDAGEALARLERAASDRAHDMALMSVDPQLSPLRTHPRFIALASRLV
jgi:Tfp pilus assembly protein PilF